MPHPDALLLIAPGCPFCPAMLEALSALVKEGAVGRLEVVNAALHPEKAEELGVRGVPWTRLGPFEFDQVVSVGELRQWAKRAEEPEALTDYAETLLGQGRLPRVEAMTKRNEALLPRLVARLGQTDLPMQVQLGIGALIEDAQGEQRRSLIPVLGELSTHSDHRVRADACHYLGLTGDAAALSHLSARLDDDHADVREIAAESLAELTAENGVC